MIKWFASLLLIFAFGSGVFAGMSLHSGEQDCEMSKMMKCCKRARIGKGTSAEVSAARLCCAVNCEQSGSTSAAVKLPQFSSLVVVALYLATFERPIASDSTKIKSDFAVGLTQFKSKPVYILHHQFRI